MCCQPRSFDARIQRIAKDLADGPTAAFGIAKGLINQAAGMDRFDVHLDHELESLARIADGAEFAEGLDSFFAKRPPRFASRARTVRKVDRSARILDRSGPRRTCRTRSARAPRGDRASSIGSDWRAFRSGRRAVDDGVHNVSRTDDLRGRRARCRRASPRAGNARRAQHEVRPGACCDACDCGTAHSSPPATKSCSIGSRWRCRDVRHLWMRRPRDGAG